MPERHLDEPPAQRREQVQPLLQQLLDLAAPELSAGRRRRVIDAQKRHVAVDPGGLHVEELGVEAAQLPHRLSLAE